MPRVKINGVIWCKAEDEFLKAAVKKYGQNQWHLIASRLTGKTIKQCKSRWDTALDPRIKKTEWSREEDEKLLYLKKLIPNKKQMIALIIGRPADQCTSRYHNLWFEAQKKAQDANAADEYNDLRILPEARARFAIRQSKKMIRFARAKKIAVNHRLKLRRHIIERRRNERNEIVNCFFSENSSEDFTDSFSYDSTTTYAASVEDNFARCLDQHLDAEYQKEREAIQRNKRPREKDDSIESLEKVEPLIKRSKVLVVPIPQYPFHNLHALRDTRCKPGFEFTRNYHIRHQCDV